MSNDLLFEKGLRILNERYDFIKRRIEAGERDVALAMYREVGHKLDFMLELGLLEFEEYRKLHDIYFDFYNIYFCCL